MRMLWNVPSRHLAMVCGGTAARRRRRAGKGAKMARQPFGAPGMAVQPAKEHHSYTPPWGMIFVCHVH
jgi:hypothetical protein